MVYTIGDITRSVQESLLGAGSLFTRHAAVAYDIWLSPAHLSKDNHDHSSTVQVSPDGVQGKLSISTIFNSYRFHCDN